MYLLCVRHSSSYWDTRWVRQAKPPPPWSFQSWGCTWTNSTDITDIMISGHYEYAEELNWGGMLEKNMVTEIRRKQENLGRKGSLRPWTETWVPRRSQPCSDCRGSIAGSRNSKCKGTDARMCLAWLSRENGSQSAGVKRERRREVTGDGGQEESMVILYGLIYHDKEFRDLPSL